MRTDYPEPDVFTARYSVDGPGNVSYPALDHFGRVTSDTWTKDLATDREFFDLDLAYDRNGNITSVVDTIHRSAAGNRAFDAKYAMDSLDRLTDADEGTYSAGSISNRTRRQLWTLDRPATGAATGSI